MKLDYKESLITKVEELTDSLESINTLSMDNVRDEQLKESFNNIKNMIFEGIVSIKHQIEVLSKDAEWSKLNVSFFGETNAGKSTIIEALKNGNGKSIGLGYKDFTKNVNKIPYLDINLIDMPGIEGEESGVIEKVKTAINKSHIIFYVVGTNKNPEKKTLKKIKSLLKDNVKVYSIINVRARPTAYKCKKELKDRNTSKTEKRLEAILTKILGAHYEGNITVNGHLALLKSNQLKNTRFEKDQIKALEIFGSKSEIESFSNIQEIYTVINHLSRKPKEHIKISNTYKFSNHLESILGKILGEKKNFDVFIQEANDLTEKYLDDVDHIISKYKSEIISSVDTNINRLKVELKKTLSNAVENGDSEGSIKYQLQSVKDNELNNLNNEIESLLSLMKAQIENKIEEFKDRMSLQFKFLNVKNDFNLENILESLEINFKYVLGQITDVGLSIAGVITAYVVNPILGIATGLLLAVKKIFQWFFIDPVKRKNEAKKRGIKKIDNTIRDVEKKISRDLNRELNKITRNTKKPAYQLKQSMKGIKKISLSIDSYISKIIKCQSNIIVNLMREYLGGEVTFSYLDLQLSRAVIIGYVIKKRKELYRLKSLFRVNKLSFYPSHTTWIKDVGKVKDELFITRDEFTYRAVNTLLLRNCVELSFNRIKKIS